MWDREAVCVKCVKTKQVRLFQWMKPLKSHHRFYSRSSLNLLQRRSCRHLWFQVRLVWWIWRKSKLELRLEEEICSVCPPLGSPHTDCWPAGREVWINIGSNLKHQGDIPSLLKLTLVTYSDSSGASVKPFRRVKTVPTSWSKRVKVSKDYLWEDLFPMWKLRPVYEAGSVR